MDTPGDITDTFDDDSLRASIEKAEQNGQWRDATGTFVDPKIESLRKQLTEPERADYAERRRRDLQRRAAAEPPSEPRTIPGPPPPPPMPPPPIDWRETVVKNPAVAPTPEPGPDADVFAQLQSRIAAENRSALPPEARLPALAYVRPVLAGLSVFLPITIVLMSVCGADFDHLVRGLLASVAAGVCWNEFQAGRFRAPLIGAAVYALSFVTTPGRWSNTEVIAHMVGFLMALLGSGVVGFLREESRSSERPRDADSVR